MTIALFVALALAVLLAWVLAAKRPEHRPIALLLSVVLAAEVAQGVLEFGVLAPLRARFGVLVPWTGWARVAVHLAEAVWLVWPASIVATSLVVFAGRKPWPAFLGWAVFVAGIVLGYPSARDGSLPRVLGGSLVLSVAISVGLLIEWFRRAATPATSAHFSLAMILAIELNSLGAAWRVGPLEHWDLSQVVYSVLLGALILLQGRFLWTMQPTS